MFENVKIGDRVRERLQMRKLLLLLLLLPFSLVAETFILDEVTLNPKDIRSFTAITICKDGKEFLYIFPPNGNPQFIQVFEEPNIPSRCQLDFKHPSQFLKSK